VCGNRPVQLWDVPTGEKTLALRLPQLGYLCLAFDPTGRRLAASTGKEIILWDSGVPEAH
jgi:hypothetical protein